MSHQRLYGTAGAEQLYFDPGEVYETQIAPYGSQVTLATIEEWSVHPPQHHLPNVEHLIEHVVESACDELTENGYDAWTAAVDDEVTAAFHAALELLASKVTFRMADKLMCTHRVTWDAQGVPLLDGAPMYSKDTP